MSAGAREWLAVERGAAPGGKDRVRFPGEWGGYGTWDDPATGGTRPAHWQSAGWQPLALSFSTMTEEPISLGYGSRSHTVREEGQVVYEAFHGREGIVNMVRAGPGVAAVGTTTTVRVVAAGFGKDDAASAKVWLIQSGTQNVVAESGPESNPRVVEFDPANRDRYRALEVDIDIPKTAPLGVYDIEVKCGDVQVAAHKAGSAMGEKWHGQHGGLVVPRAVHAAKIELEEVWFTDFTGATGIQMQDHFNDANGDNVRDAGETLGDADINGPEWRADGPDADSLPDRRKHALFARDDKFKVKAVFAIEGIDPAAGEVVAWAKCTDRRLALGWEGSPVALQKAGGRWHGVFGVQAAPDAIGVLRDFTWRWHVRVKGSAPTTRESTHTVLVCRQAITGYKPYDWVAWWACGMAAGEDTPDDIVAALFAKVPDTASYGPKIDLNHVPGSHQGNDTKYLLDDHQGTCGEWMAFFYDLAKVHSAGVTKERFTVFRAAGQPAEWFAQGFKVPPTVRDIDGDPIAVSYGGHAYCKYNGAVYDAMTATHVPADADGDIDIADYLFVVSDQYWFRADGGPLVWLTRADIRGTQNSRWVLLYSNITGVIFAIPDKPPFTGPQVQGKAWP